jgi:hypothetical protein
VPENEEKDHESESSRRQGAVIEIRRWTAGINEAYGPQTGDAGTGKPQTER